MNYYGIIYKITNNINGKCYIGQTTKEKGFDGRYHGDIYKNTHNIHLKRAIEKYGINNFTIEKEFDTAHSKEELNKKEKDYICKFNSNDYRYGYNVKSGGDNVGNIKGKYKVDFLLREGVPVLCKTTCEIFLSIKDASRKYNIGTSSIVKQCSGLTNFKKETFFNKKLGKYLEFEYYDLSSKGKKKPVIDIVTKQRFRSVAATSRFLNVDSEVLRNHLNKRSKCVKGRPDIHVMYLYDYTLENYEEMASLPLYIP